MKNYPFEIAMGAALFAGALAFTFMAWSRGELQAFDVGVALALGAAVGGVVYAIAQVYEWKINESLPANNSGAVPATVPQTQNWEVVDEDAEAAAGYWFIGDKAYSIPNTVDRKDLDLIAAARRNGRLGYVSLRSLHDVGISRFKSAPPNASSTFDWLKARGWITTDGTWTESGASAFPPATRNS